MAEKTSPEQLAQAVEGAERLETRVNIVYFGEIGHLEGSTNRCALAPEPKIETYKSVRG